jgi:hypothetical protein
MDDEGNIALSDPDDTYTITNPNGAPGPGEDAINIRMPKIDCTYMGNNTINVVIKYRLGEDTLDPDTWDLETDWLEFEYNPTPSIGEHLWTINDRIEWTSDDMADADGQTHPDIVYDQATGDVYCAWSEYINASNIDIYYQLHEEGDDPGDWSDPGLLNNDDINDSIPDHSGWFVNLDVGNVNCTPCGLDDDRTVAWTYTGQFNNQGQLSGFRVMVGWDDISASGTMTGDQSPLLLIVLPCPDEEENCDDFRPETGQWPSSGLSKIDIAKDNATNAQGAALVFVQEVGQSTGIYDVYGGNSLDPADFLSLGNIDGAATYDSATLPSLAIHESGITASVSYFGEVSNWVGYAIHWDLANNILAEAGETILDAAADGEFDLEIDDMLHHNYGTASSLAVIDAGDNKYWAAWSDSVNMAVEPIEVHATFGFAKVE